MLELRTPTGRHRTLSVAIALLLAIQLLVVASDPGDTTTGGDAESIAQLAEQALQRVDTGDGTTTTTPAPTSTLPPFVPPAATPTTRAATGTGNGTGRSPSTTAPKPTVPPLNPPSKGCGDRITKADGTPWVCTWADNFDGTALDASHWSPMLTKVTAFSTGGECMVDQPQNINVADGSLHLTAIAEEHAFTCESNTPKKNFSSQVTSGMVTTLGKWSQAYGRFEVRAKLPGGSIRGLVTSFWMWPDDPTRYGAWPASGEIDFMEWYSRHPDLVIPYVHYLPAGGNQTAQNCKVAKVADWHNYTLEWTPDLMTISIDGTPCLVTDWTALLLTAPAPFDQPFSLSLTQAVGPQNGNPYVAGTTPMPATTTIDYVRVWR